MPQYDPDPAILEERCYAWALQSAQMDFDDLAYEDTSDDELQDWRERLRSDLLDEFPDLDGPLIADLMDDGLSAAGFPLHRV